MRKSGIRKYPQKYFYSEVEKWSNFYAYQLGLGGSYSKNFYHISIDYLVQWDGIFIRGGVRGGLNGAMYSHWEKCAR